MQIIPNTVVLHRSSKDGMDGYCAFGAIRTVDEVLGDILVAFDTPRAHMLGRSSPFNSRNPLLSRASNVIQQPHASQQAVVEIPKRFLCCLRDG